MAKFIPFIEKHKSRPLVSFFAGNADAGEERVGKAVPDAAQAKLIPAFFFLEKGEDTQIALPESRVVANPRQVRQALFIPNCI